MDQQTNQHMLALLGFVQAGIDAAHKGHQQALIAVAQQHVAAIEAALKQNAPAEQVQHGLE